MTLAQQIEESPDVVFDQACTGLFRGTVRHLDRDMFVATDADPLVVQKMVDDHITEYLKNKETECQKKS